MCILEREEQGTTNGKPYIPYTLTLYNTRHGTPPIMTRPRHTCVMYPTLWPGLCTRTLMTMHACLALPAV